MSAPRAGRPDRPWRRAFRLPSSTRQAAADVEREIGFHLAMREADLVAAGLTPEAARAEARRQFGDPAAVGAECLAEERPRQRWSRWKDGLAALGQDLAYAGRALRRAPGFTLAAAITLGLGLGATTAVFSVVDSVLLRPLPIAAPDRVVALVPHVGGTPRPGSPGLLAAWDEQSTRLAHIAAATGRSATLLERGGATRLDGAAVSGDYFTVLGVRAALGRLIAPADDVPGAPDVVVLSHTLWARTFAADPHIAGRTVVLDGAPRVVIGVAPAALDPALGDEFWVPLALAPSQRANFTPYLTLIARLAPGATAAAAAAELDAIVVRLGAPAADDGVTPTVDVRPADRELLGEYRRPLFLLLAAAGAVLLIGCANVSTLVLARSATRARELAVRAALGAGRGRLTRQLAAEHLVLGLLATAVAVPVAAAGTAALVAAIPAGVPRIGEAALDARALAAVVALGISSALLCGLAPAAYQRRLATPAALRAGARAGGDRRGDGWRRALVGAEVAAALVLLVGAGLLIRSAAALGAVAPGFDVERVLTARVALPQRDYPELPRAVAAYEAIAEAARAQPGVSSAALVSRVPLGGSATSVDVTLADRPTAGDAKVNAAVRITSPHYFRTMGIPLLAGRDLAHTDRADAARVVVVNAALARQLGGVDAVVGRYLRSDNGAFADEGGAPRPMQIVGVAGDVRDDGPRGWAPPMFYAPMGQVSEEPWDHWIGREMLLVARGTGDAAAAAPLLRRAVAAVDPRVPLYDVQTTAQRLAGALAVERLTTRLLAVLGACGLALAALGIHGVVAYAVTQRTREVGVRLALGATARDAVALVVRQSMRPVVVGLALGAVAAVLAARAAAGLLFGVSPADPATLALAALALGAVALAACYWPARRMARVDPAGSLRGD